ncbi:hypothetical protein MMC17_005500 [Xylographa soralifera]|nr:hypothetical protein [Xylographa soralifera]
MAEIAEPPDANVMRAGFEANADALDIAAQQLRDAAAANRNIAVQVSRLPQAPILQGQAILALIQAVQVEIQAVKVEIREMRIESRARDYNMQARLYNSRIALPQSPLRVLFDIRIAQPIANFPAHLAALQAES